MYLSINFYLCRLPFVEIRHYFNEIKKRVSEENNLT